MKKLVVMLVLIPSLALAQSTVKGNQGDPNKGAAKAWPIVIDDGFGNHALISNYALNTRMTPVVGGTGYNVYNVADESVFVDATGMYGVTFQITAVSSPNLTIVPEASVDYGTTWVQTPGFIRSDGVFFATLVNPAAGIYELIVPNGAQDVRVRVSSYASGSVTGYLTGNFLSRSDLAGTAIPNTTFVLGANTTTNVKAGPGQVYGVSCSNPNASACFLQFYNTSGSPTCGSAVVWSLALPASGTLNAIPNGMALAAHSSGIATCAGTTATGASACASAVACTIFYR